MKTKEELNALKEEVETVSKKLAELTDEELVQVSGGAMINPNMAAINTLNQLNRNSSALNKSLQKLSTGMKINSSTDDSSGYQISERMRVQIRALDQANYNTQNEN